MTTSAATLILGRGQPRFAIRNLVLALANKPAEALRLRAAKHVLKHWETYRVLNQHPNRDLRRP